MRDLIIDMANKNIGSLCLFLKNEKNSNYLDFINSTLPAEISNYSLSEKVYYFVNNIKFPILCECGKPKSFIGFKNGHRPTCGDKKCFVKKRKETCLEKWGVDNPKKAKDILEKEKQQILKKWGGKHYMFDPEVRDRFKKTMIDNWGVEWSQQSKEISDKSKSTWYNNPNRDKIITDKLNKMKMKSDDEKNEIQKKKKQTITQNWGSLETLYKHNSEKIKEKAIQNFGVEHHLSHPEVIEKRVRNYKEKITNKIKSLLPNNLTYIDREPNSTNTDSLIKLKCLDCDNLFLINRQYLVNRKKNEHIICLNCNPKLSGTSHMEKELLDFIKENYTGEIITSDKKLLSGLEIDIYLPDIKLSFEFNGLYWHSDEYKDRMYHINKTKKCLEMGINLIHIWEDDWCQKKDIVKSIILNKLGDSEKIWARKCTIREIDDNKLIREFLEKNHIQGFVGSSVKIGLFYKEELVSLMTFGSLRKSLGQKSQINSYELLRFCNKKNISIVGGASKIFKYFLNKWKPNEIISYSDNSRSTGNLYEKLCFNLISETEPNYYWIIDGVRRHRFNFRKDRLVKLGYDSQKTEIQIMTELGYSRIFDCGSKKWIFSNNSPNSSQ